MKNIKLKKKYKVSFFIFLLLIGIFNLTYSQKFNMIYDYYSQSELENKRLEFGNQDISKDLEILFDENEYFMINTYTLSFPESMEIETYRQHVLNATISVERILDNKKWDKDESLQIAYFYRYFGYNIEAIQTYTHILMMEDISDSLELTVIYSGRGESKYNMNDYYGAIEDLKIAQSIKLFTSTITLLGKCYFELDDYKTAYQYFTTAINKLEESKYKYLDLGLNYYFRAFCNLNLDNKTSACKDFSNAGQYGVTKAYEEIKKYCK